MLVVDVIGEQRLVGSVFAGPVFISGARYYGLEMNTWESSWVLRWLRWAWFWSTGA